MNKHNGKMSMNSFDGLVFGGSWNLTNSVLLDKEADANTMHGMWVVKHNVISFVIRFQNEQWDTGHYLCKIMMRPFCLKDKHWTNFFPLV